MIKRLVLASSLLLLVACGKEEPPKLVTVENAEVISTSDRGCFRHCSWNITVKKGDTTLKMDTSSKIVESVSVGSKITLTYNADKLKVTSVSFPDFENKEIK